MKTVTIQGKEYVTVNERIKYFREKFTGYRLTSEMLSDKDGVVIFKASVLDEAGNVLATGHAREKENSTFINKTSHVENCETSAWGRALANYGIGVDSSVASADEVANAIKQQQSTAEPIDPKHNFSKIKLVEEEEIKERLKSYRSMQSVINLWKKLTEEQQENEDIKGWFSIKRQQLKDEGIYA